MTKPTEHGQSLNLEILLPVIYWPPSGLSTISAARSTLICSMDGYRYRRDLLPLLGT